MTTNSAGSAPVLTKAELIALILPEVHTALDDYARNFMARMMAGEEPSEWDYMAAEIAADAAVELGEFLRLKK